jgi:hypothetical protein
MAQVHGIINRDQLYWDGQGWSANPKDAADLTDAEAHRQLRIINANNRFLDREDQAEARVVESV